MVLVGGCGVTYWLSLNLFAGLVTSAAIWSRYPTRARLLAVLAFLALMPVSWGIMQARAGWAVEPIAYVSELPAEAEILGVSLVQDVAIYVMLGAPGQPPRLFRLPWSNEQGSKLQRLMEANAENGGKLTAKRGQPGEDYPIEFWGEPQPPTPDKQPEASAPTYERQG
jgi:hypothetical protein